ncbi:MAG: 30S ribosome-binding factor RbfA [Deltaproteobacteria bacterium]|nr:30S ribosome-binding factor RbfA [Deltaproteobacteria bacterium]
MIPNRTQRFGELLKEEITSIISRKVRDPRIGFITINEVEVKSDFKSAIVYYTVIGDDEQRKKTSDALGKMAGFIHRELKSSHLAIRTLPSLSFKYDTSLDYGEKIDATLKRINKL